MMGHLYYGSRQHHVTFDDRLLWHIKLVVVAKLRRQENFTFSWIDNTTGGLTCIWIHPQCDLIFEFGTTQEQNINKAWLDSLMQSANTTGGMHVITEPTEAT